MSPSSASCSRVVTRWTMSVGSEAQPLVVTSEVRRGLQQAREREPGLAAATCCYAPNAAAEATHSSPLEAATESGTPPASPAEKASSAAEALLPSLSIWPPSQRTRDAVVRRVVQTLSAPSVLTQRYGALPEPEAERAAAAVEAEAFAAASDSATASPASLEDGIEVLQAYSKEVSRRLLELAKARASATSPAPLAEPKDEESEASSATAPVPAEE